MNSIWLFDILNIIAVDFRKYCQRFSITREIMSTFYVNNKSVYMVGSTYEGTRLPGNVRDIDILLCYESPRVIEDLAIAEQDSSNTFLLIRRETNTRAGYVKLQLVARGVPLTLPRWAEYITPTLCKCDQFQRVLLIDVNDIERSSEENIFRQKTNLLQHFELIGITLILCYVIAAKLGPNLPRNGF
ncbi:unnamed protein product [Mytilus edulis]|uniref:Uncharacterized protein n=1 Tax=Mytilus edulis TaxID=6550 RepID=A0A8S3UMQ9_MYTED|nr:unnamed protein product [Mytilus edulis]